MAFIYWAGKLQIIVMEFWPIDDDDDDDDRLYLNTLILFSKS